MVCKSLLITKSAPPFLFQKTPIDIKVSIDHLESLRNKIILANNIVDDVDLQLLGVAISYFQSQLESIKIPYIQMVET
jgi:hypothetical protein